MASSMRKSLAPVSTNALNGRQSIAPGRQSLAPGKMGPGRMSVLGGPRPSSIGARQSMAPGRRSTLAAAGPTKTIDDPRNIKDKAFIRAAQHRLIEFLVQNNYDRQISPKQLDAPTTKDYLHILIFLYNKIDPLFQLSQNVSEDVPAMFKRLRYPFNISKSHLQAVGSPHAWPSLLAALVWLVELLEYEQRVEVAMQEEFSPGDENADKIFFENLSRSYHEFLNGEEDEDLCKTALEENLAQAFAIKNESTQEEVTRLSKAIKAMEEEIETLQESKLETLQEKRNMLVKDLEKFKLLITNLEKHLEEVKRKTEELKEDAAAKELEKAAVEKEKAELQEVVAHQETRAIDAHRIASERQKLQDDLRRTGREKDSLQAEIYQAEIALANKQAELERQIQEYHRTATELKLIPATAKHADGVSFEIPVASRGNGVEQLVALGGKKTLRDDLVAKTDQLQARQQEQVSNRIVEEERLHEAEVAVVEKREEVGQLEEECRAREAALVREKEALDQELRETAAELQSIEEMVANGSTLVKARVVAARKRFEELTRTLGEQQTVYHSNRASRNDALMRLCSLAAEHKLQVQERLQELESRCLAIQNHIATA